MSTFPRSHYGSDSIANSSAAKLSKTQGIFRSIGYTLLSLSLVDLLYVLVPPEFTNPVWEYQTVGDLVKLIPVPLLALILVFYGETASRRKLERQVLRMLSWLTLVIGISFLLLIPLTISNTARISQYNNQQISTQVNQQNQQLDATRQQLEQATPEQLQNLVPVPDENGNLPDAPNSPDQAKTQLLVNLEQAKQQAENQADQARSNLRQNLLKNTLKLVAGSLLGGFAFLYVWASTQWARQMKSYTNEPALAPSSSPMAKKLQSFMPKLPRRFRFR